MPRTQLSQWQINTRELFSVKQILLSRGYEVTKEEGYENLLLKRDMSDALWEDVFEIFNTTSLRNELRDYLYNNKKEVHTDKLKHLISQPDFIKERHRFDNTFEWFAGEVMIKKFAAFSSSFGVQVKNILRNSTATAAGDYDALVILRDTNIAYFECKAGDFDADSIMKCYERMLSLNCEYSIFICGKKLDEEKLKWECKRIKIPMINFAFLNTIHVKNHPNDIIYDLHNCYIMDMYNNIENKIRTVLRLNSAKINQLHFFIGLDDEAYGKLGFSYKNLQLDTDTE